MSVSSETGSIETNDGPELVVDLRDAPTSLPVIDLRPALGIVGDRYIIDDTHMAVVFDANDPIHLELIALEVQQLVDLGDEPVEARAWCEKTIGAVWIALFEQGDQLVAENVQGILRLTGPAGSHRMLADLGVLLETSPEFLRSDIANRVGMESIEPYLDATTLDITARGATSKDHRFANLFRLLLLLLGTSARAASMHGFASTTALVHPRVLKHATASGIPLRDLGYGILRYKLSDTNTSPMETQLTLARTDEIRAALTTDKDNFPVALVLDMMRRSGLDLFPVERDSIFNELATN